jgi:hypothetical protein
MPGKDTAATMLAQQLLFAVKTGENTVALQEQLAHLPLGQLQQQLFTDSLKTAFWLNMYNAYTQIFLQEDTAAYARRNKFFSAKKIVVEGIRLSLDDIEHGLLRRSKNKWLMGYIGKLWPGKTEKRWRVQHADYRIHFALNCGANSCPPIAFYHPEHIDRLLQLAMTGFLKEHCHVDTTSNVVWVPKIMSWFRGDFGGKAGIRQLLILQGILPPGAKPRLRFSPYNWALAPGAFASNIPQ